MAKINSKINTRSQDFLENTEHMQAQVNDLKAKLEEIKLGGGNLKVVGIKMSFGAILMLFIKITLASIPAMIILGGIIFLIHQAIIMIGSFI